MSNTDLSGDDVNVGRLVAGQVSVSQFLTSSLVSGTIVMGDKVEARVELTARDRFTATSGSFSGQVVVGSLATLGSVGAGEMRASKARVTGELKADQVSTRSTVTDDLRATSITGGRLRGTVVESMRGVDIGAGISAVMCAADAVTVTDPAARTQVTSEVLQLRADRSEGSTTLARPTDPQPSPFPRPTTTQPVAPRIALFHQFTSERDQLVLNHLGRYGDGVRIVGDLHVDGAVVESSSAALKDDVHPVGLEAATTALAELRPVSYRYHEDPHQARRLGFIAEEVPEIVAQPARDRIRTMDVVALLTAVLQDQQRTIAALRTDVAELQADRERSDPTITR